MLRWFEAGMYLRGRRPRLERPALKGSSRLEGVKGGQNKGRSVALKLKGFKGLGLALALKRQGPRA